MKTWLDNLENINQLEQSQKVLRENMFEQKRKNAVENYSFAKEKIDAVMSILHTDIDRFNMVGYSTADGKKGLLEINVIYPPSVLPFLDPKVEAKHSYQYLENYNYTIKIQFGSYKNNVRTIIATLNNSNGFDIKHNGNGSGLQRSHTININNLTREIISDWLKWVVKGKGKTQPFESRFKEYLSQSMEFILAIIFLIIFFLFGVWIDKWLNNYILTFFVTLGIAIGIVAYLSSKDKRRCPLCETKLAGKKVGQKVVGHKSYVTSHTSSQTIRNQQGKSIGSLEGETRETTEYEDITEDLLCCKHCGYRWQY